MRADDMDAKKPKRTHLHRNWPAVLDKFRQSNQTIKAFCLAEGIPQSLFYKRRKDQINSCQSTSPPLVRSDFIELSPASTSQWSAAIIFGHRVELSIANNCNHELLRQLISQLKG